MKQIKPKFKKSPDFNDLVFIMRTLLGSKGCPWDKKQTHKSLLKYLSEEASELREAVRKNDFENMKEELGDILLQVVFHSVLAEQAGRFSAADVIKSINSKLIRRHPHVFGKLKISTPGQLLKEWRRIKEREKNTRR